VDHVSALHYLPLILLCGGVAALIGAVAPRHAVEPPLRLPETRKKATRPCMACGADYDPHDDQPVGVMLFCEDCLMACLRTCSGRHRPDCPITAARFGATNRTGTWSTPDDRCKCKDREECRD
jgi:hypothetical protein